MHLRKNDPDVKGQLQLKPVTPTVLTGIKERQKNGYQQKPPSETVVRGLREKSH